MESMDSISNFPFEVGQLTESRTFLSGYRGAWFRCKIKGIDPRGGRKRLRLEYFDFPDEKQKWTVLYQKIPSGRVNQGEMQLMVRPRYPPLYKGNQMPDLCKITETTLIVNDAWRVGDLVDWWCDDCYWSGSVAQLLGDDKVQVALLGPPGGEGGLYEALCMDLRPSLDWSVEHGWNVPVPEANGNDAASPCARLVEPSMQNMENAVDGDPVENCNIGGDPVENCNVGGDPVENCNIGGDPKENNKVGGDPKENNNVGGDPKENNNVGGDPKENKNVGGDPKENKNVGGDPKDNSNVGGDPKENNNVGEDPKENNNIGGDPKENNNIGGDPKENNNVGGDPKENKNVGGDPVQNNIDRLSDSGKSSSLEVSKDKGTGNFYRKNDLDLSPKRQDGLEASSGASKRMRVSANEQVAPTATRDAINSAIMDLEEIANKVKWLKNVLKFGFGWSNAMKPSWKFIENDKPSRRGCK